MNPNDRSESTKESSSTPGLFIFLMFMISLLVIGYLDFYILTPAILPADHCYYHFHPIPWWVDVFYLNGASNGHPDGSLTHLLTYIILSFFAGLKSSRALYRYFHRN